LQELTDAELIKTFKNTNINLYGKSGANGGENTGHGLSRLRDERLSGLGVKTPNDIARILIRGAVYRSTSKNTIGRHLDGVAVVLDAKTYNLVTVTPVGSKNRGF